MLIKISRSYIVIMMMTVVMMMRILDFDKMLSIISFTFVRSNAENKQKFVL